MIMTNFRSVKVGYIATDGEEAIKVISSNQFDLVLLDLKLPIMNGKEVIENVTKLNYITCPKFIIISEDTSEIKRLKYDSIISDIINKAESEKVVCEKIGNIINEIDHENYLPQIMNFTIAQLQKYGYDFKLKGTIYLMETILYIYSNNNMNLLDNLEQNVYKYVAFKHKKTVLNVKTSITKATNLIQNSTMRITSKSVVSMILIEIFNKFN